MKNYVKKEKGITLIALVITIIVLLILAGIAIAALSGENGILTRASEAKQKTAREEIVEKAKLKILEAQTEKQRDLTDEEAMAIIAKYDKNYKENEAFEFDINEQGEEYFTTNKEEKILVSEIWRKNPSEDTGKIEFSINIAKDNDSDESPTKYGGSFEVEKGTTWREFLRSKFCRRLDGVDRGKGL